MIVNPTRISFSNFSDSRDVNGLPMVSCADESALDLNVSRLVFSPQSSIAPKNDSPLIRMDHEALEIQVPVKKKENQRNRQVLFYILSLSFCRRCHVSSFVSYYYYGQRNPFSKNVFFLILDE